MSDKKQNKMQPTRMPEASTQEELRISNGDADEYGTVSRLQIAVLRLFLLTAFSEKCYVDL